MCGEQREKRLTKHETSLSLSLLLKPTLHVPFSSSFPLPSLLSSAMSQQHHQLHDQLKATLTRREEIAKLRRLVVNPPTAIDFSSNDFLGLTQNSILRERYLNELQQLDRVLGSTGSRLLDGNSQYAIDLETKIATFHGAETALLFNSGFDANAGFFATVPQKGDIIIYDELIHASVHEGMRMSRAARCIPFKHSDVNDLNRILMDLGETTSNVFVALETVYSMDGDVAPLPQIVDTLKKYWPNRENGHIVVDEVNGTPNTLYITHLLIPICYSQAHSTGVYGNNGRGVVAQFGLEDEIFARLHTFGKALASNGGNITKETYTFEEAYLYLSIAVILGSNILREYLINYARPLIYSTFMSFSSLASIKCAYDMLASGETIPVSVLMG